jgi:protein SCO1/2
MADRHPFPVGTLLLAALLALAILLTWLLVKPPSPPAELEGVLRSEFRQLTPFHLQSRGHGPVDLGRLRGKWTFVFFGYRSCPDVCPNTLHELGAMQTLLADRSPELARQVQVLFVSVDPGRDSAEQLESYAAYFGPRIIGATAGRGALDRLTKQFGAAYRVEPETAPGEYRVSHSSAIFLVDPYARLVAAFSQPHYAAELLAQFRRIVDYYGRAGPGTGPEKAEISAIAPARFPEFAPGPDAERGNQQQVDDHADTEEYRQRVARAGVGARVAAGELGLVFTV